MSQENASRNGNRAMPRIIEPSLLKSLLRGGCALAVMVLAGALAAWAVAFVALIALLWLTTGSLLREGEEGIGQFMLLMFGPLCFGWLGALVTLLMCLLEKARISRRASVRP